MSIYLVPTNLLWDCVKFKKINLVQFRCSGCDVIFEKKSQSRHKALCNDQNPSHRRGVEPTFFQAVYGRMNQGPHKKQLASDPELIYIGNCIYTKIKLNRSNDTNPSVVARKNIYILT